MKESHARRAVFNAGRVAGPIVGDEPARLDLDPREQRYRAQLKRRFARLTSAPGDEVDRIFDQLVRRGVDVVEDVIAAFGEPEPEAGAWPDEPPPSYPGGRAGQLLADYRADEDVRKSDHRARVAAARRGDLGVIWRKVKVKGKSFRVGFERSPRSPWGRRAPRLLERGNPYRAVRALVRRDLAKIEPKIPRRLLDAIIAATLK
jgi:hypothetical protein